jgi:hypothetical protein
VQTPQQKQQYIDSYYLQEGIHLDPEKIQKNPGLRSLSKLALNSFYGKFGQRGNMPKTKLVRELDEMYKLFTDPSKQVINWHILREDMLMMEYKDKETFGEDSKVGNVVIAAMCTCWARLKLWGSMKKLGYRVLYHDTDSIIFTVKTGEPVPLLGDYLGDFTNELACKELGCGGCEQGHWIEEFISCGPKNYSYRLNTGETVCKVRGFSLNYQNSQVLNFNSMKEALFSWHRGDPESFYTVSTMILRDKYNPQIYNRKVSKKYGVVYDKRQVLPNLTTIPYGFQGIIG